jgi:hypothetical protein
LTDRLVPGMLHNMKKLSIILAAAGSFAIATPVFACPGHDTQETPKTADKTPTKEEPKTDAPKKDAPKATEAPKTAKEQPKKDAPKTPTKVSQK